MSTSSLSVILFLRHRLRRLMCESDLVPRFCGGGRLLGAALLLPQVFKLLRSASKFFFCRLTCARHGEHGVVHRAANGAGRAVREPCGKRGGAVLFHLASAAESSLSLPHDGQTRGARRVFGAPHNFCTALRLWRRHCAFFSAASCSLKMVCVCNSDASRSLRHRPFR